MLLASLLAVVAGSPAQAANTAFEVLKNDKREFAGQDRYDTALLLAKNFATTKGGLGSVPAVFIASGETLVDSISVAGLAGYTDAPILLTPSGNLQGGVKDFIEDYDVRSVHVLGGSAAVSDNVITAIEGLSSNPTVNRIAGDDRHATAAQIAGMIDTDANWCGSDAVSAILINGATDMLGYGVAVQTTAYKLQMPVLMTDADELPEATAAYITENDVEHVQIIGGGDVVSADVASALTTLGVDTVERVDGSSAAEVSVMLAKLANNGCSEDLAPVASNRVALVRANPDGVVAAPVLASTLVADSLVTPLVVGDTLPTSVRDYLAATPKTVPGGTDKLNLGIVAIGGTAAVSEAVMAAAIEAAASSGALTVAIGASTNTNNKGGIDASDPIRPGTGTTDSPLTFLLHFSDDVVSGTDSSLLSHVRDVIEINGVPATVTAAAPPSTATAACDNRTIEVSIAETLQAGDVVSVADSALRFGTGADQRTVSGASTTVQAQSADRTRPKITIIGIAGAATARESFDVLFSDNVGVASSAALDNAEVSVVAAPGKPAVPSPSVTVVTAGSYVTVGIGRPLEVGDRLVIKPGAIEDTAAPTPNVSAGTSGTAIKAQASPRISSVLMSNLMHSDQNTWTVNTTLVTGATSPNDITIEAKKGGAADGAAGNAWKIVFDKAGSYSAEKPLDIDVRVESKGKRVTVRFNNGPATATLGDLLKALNGDPEFSALFTAGFTTCANAATGSRTALGVSAVTGNDSRNQPGTASGAGETQFAVEVNFNAFIDSYDGDQLLNDVLARTVARASGVTDRAALEALDGFTITRPTADPTQPIRQVRFEFTVDDSAHLPQSRDLVETAAGLGTRSACTAAGRQAPAITAAIAPIATGYLANQARVTGGTGVDAAGGDCDRVDEQSNGATQRRIAVSSSVKARN